MILGVNRRPSLHEAVAVIQIAQALQKREVTYFCPKDFPSDLLAAADMLEDTDKPNLVIDLDRPLDHMSDTELAYADVLAMENGLYGLPIQAPKLSLVPAKEQVIALCPFALSNDLDLPIGVWAGITRMLRSYGLPVVLIADHQYRLDSAEFTEADTASTWPLHEKLALLASAKLIVGVPNGYTWIGAGLKTCSIIYYPDHVPNARWFGFEGHGRNYTLLGYKPGEVQLAWLLAKLRIMISNF